MSYEVDIKGEKKEIKVDLENQQISFGNKTVKFELDNFKKKCLIEGLDDIDLSMQKINHVDNFEKKNGYRQTLDTFK